VHKDDNISSCESENFSEIQEIADDIKFLSTEYVSEILDKTEKELIESELSNNKNIRIKRAPTITILEDKTDFSVVKHIKGKEQQGYESMINSNPKISKPDKEPRPKTRHSTRPSKTIFPISITSQPIVILPKNIKQAPEPKPNIFSVSKPNPKESNLKLKLPPLNKKKK